MSTNLEYRARERQRKRESRRQASEAQREKGRQRSRARDKKTDETVFFGRTAEKFYSGKFFAEIYLLNTQVDENLFEEKVHLAVLV